MSSSNMNFGPEWMRRLSRANSAQNLESLGNASNGSDGPVSPTGSIDRSGAPSNTSYSSVTSKQKAEAARLALESSTSAECLNPFLYTREFMLSLYRPTEAPLDFESHDYVYSDDPLPPMAHFSLSEAETALLACGQINSTARRNPSGPYPAAGSGARATDRQHSREGILRGREKAGLRTAGTKINNSPWATAGKNSLGSFGADGVFRLDGAGEMLLDQRDYERLEAERLAQHLAYAAGSDNHAIANAELVAQLNQARYAAGEEPIPLDPSGVAPAKGRGSLKNILAGLAGFDIDDPEASPNNETSNWLYKDPTGTIQGPFTSFDMHEWYRLGYFVGDLLVRREEESTFEPLGVLIARVGDDEAPFLTPPRASHLRTILTPRSARGFMGSSSGLESEAGLGFPYAPSNSNFGLSSGLPSTLEQSRLANDFGGGVYNDSYASQIQKAALFQEAALYQAQQERQQYLQLLQRQQQAVMSGYNSLYGMPTAESLSGFHGFDQEALRMAYQNNLGSGVGNLSNLSESSLQNLQAQQEMLQAQQGWGSQSQEAPVSAGLEPWKDHSNQILESELHSASVDEVASQMEKLNVKPSSSKSREVEVPFSKPQVETPNESARSNINSTEPAVVSPTKTKNKAKKAAKKAETSPPLPASSTPESSSACAPWSGASKPAKSFIQIQQEEAAERAHAKASNEGTAKRYADTVVKSAAPSWGPTRSAQSSPTVSKSASRPDSNTREKPPTSDPKRNKPQINPQQPPPPSDKFLNWSKTMLKHLDVKVDDVISMLTGFPLDPPSDFYEIIQELFHDQHSSSGIDPAKFAEEFIVRRKVDCGVLNRSSLPSPGLQPPSPANSSFQVVAKKNRKKAA